MGSLDIFKPTQFTFLSSTAADKSYRQGRELSQGSLGEKRERYRLCYAPRLKDFIL